MKKSFTKEQYEAARQADLLTYLQKEGYSLIKKGSSYCLKEHDSLMINNNKWNWFSRGIGGSTIEFLTNYENMSLVEAVLKLNGESFGKIYKPEENAIKDKKKILKLPKQDYNNDIVFNYLTRKRHIDEEIVSHCFENELIYQTKDIKACAFVGFDEEDGEVKHVYLRGTGEERYHKDVYGSSKEHNFKLFFNKDRELPAKSVYVFESPIDALSHATILKKQGLNYKKQSRITLNGIGSDPLDNFLKGNESVEKIILCLDNDKTGIEAMKKLSEKYSKEGYVVSKIPPEAKDYNEDLRIMSEGKVKRFMEHYFKKIKDNQHDFFDYLDGSIKNIKIGFANTLFLYGQSKNPNHFEEEIKNMPIDKTEAKKIKEDIVKRLSEHKYFNNVEEDRFCKNLIMLMILKKIDLEPQNKKYEDKMFSSFLLFDEKKQKVILNTIFKDAGNVISEIEKQQEAINRKKEVNTKKTEKKPIFNQKLTNKASFFVEKNGENYTIDNLDKAYEGGAKTRYKNNVEAIKIIKENKFIFTNEDKEKLSRYVGWGGLPQAFDAHNDKWREECKELKELLSPEEYARAKGSTLNAHYTSPEIINEMYSALRHFGVNKGKLLEPSCGTGNFIGCIPEDMDFKVSGTELDTISGKIAQSLYPKAKIQIEGFENSDYRRNQFNVVIGNIPFGSYKVFDPEYNKKDLFIHDYFINKSLELTEKGGIAALITSKGTLDKEDTKARLEIAKKADLIGAIRLPNNAFTKNANTEVTTDILFFKKLDFERDVENNVPDWVNTGELNGIRLNQYFIDNPNMMIGKMAYSKKMYGNGRDTTLEPLENVNLPEEINKRIGRLPDNIYEYINKNEEAERLDELKNSIKPFCFGIDEDTQKVYYNGINGLEEQKVTERQYERYKKYIELKQAVKAVIEIQVNDGEDNGLKERQIDLTTKFDKFTKNFGHFDGRDNKRFLSLDDEIALVNTLETKNKDGIYIKSQFFTERTISPALTDIRASNPEEALILSMDRKGCCDIDYMAEISGIDKEIIKDELLNNNQIFIEPESGNIVPSFIYLSGNVKEKLKIAKAYAETDTSFLKNVKELEKVIPDKVYFNEISIGMGSNLIKPEYINDFMKELIGYDNISHNTNYIKYDASWQIEHASATSSRQATENYGTERMNAYQILERMLNNASMNQYDYTEENGSRKRKLNTKATTLVNGVKAEIEREFTDFLNKRPDIQEKIENEYNERFNSEVPLDYKNFKLSFDGLNPSIKEMLRDNQKEGISQSIFGGNTLLAQTTGAGKTFTMIISAMEKKRLGMINKPTFILPKHLVGQFSLDFKRCYPQANMLITEPKDFEKKNRKSFTARIAQGNYDAVIMSYEQFGKIPVSQSRVEENIQEELKEIEFAIEKLQAKEDSRISVKNLERTKKSLEERLKSLSTDFRKDDLLTFEELGIDGLYVDEAHEYKNLYFATKLSNVGGISPKPTKKTQDMNLKLQYLYEKNPGNVVFATATPVSNSMSELYTMMRYLQPEKLKEDGIYHFDAWVNMFAKIKESLELKPTGNGYRYKTRFSSFNNLPELMKKVRQFANIVTADMIKLPVPELKEGKRIAVICEPTAEFEMKQEEINEELTRIESGSSSKNHLQIFNECKLNAMDLRLLDIKAKDDENNKVSKASDNIFEIYKDGKEEKLTQIVFSDVGTPNKDRFNIYDELKRKLIEKGVPAEEIEFIHDANTNEKKNALFEKVRKGEVRVLLGSTRKLGTGANIQDKLVALHHLDVPYRPADLEQREGRILRVGNKNKEVAIYNYVTENSIESYLWQILEQKQRYISQIMSGQDIGTRSSADVDEATLSFSELKAITTGNPYIKEKMDVDNEVERLGLWKLQFNRKISESKRYLENAPEEIEKIKERINDLKTDYDTFKKSYEENGLNITLGKNKELCTDKELAAERVGEFFKNIKENKAALQEKLNKEPKVGTINGLNIKIDAELENLYIGKEIYIESKLYMSGENTLNKAFENINEKIPKKIENLKEKIMEMKENIKTAEVEISKSFPHEQELFELTKRKVELDMLFAESEEEIVYDTENQGNSKDISSELFMEETELEYE